MPGDFPQFWSKACCCSMPYEQCCGRREREAAAYQSAAAAMHRGCVCPPTSEQTCRSPYCPRQSPFAGARVVTGGTSTQGV